MSDDRDALPLCARCSPTCCEGREIYVTPGDVDRIIAFGGWQDFFEFIPPSDPAYGDQDDDPQWARCVFQIDGTRRVLRRKARGACYFLDPQGCSLPTDVRPLVCRLYPYDYDERGIKDELLAGCPVHLLGPGQELIAVLGMNPHDALRWHGQLYREIQLERSMV